MNLMQVYETISVEMEAVRERFDLELAAADPCTDDMLRQVQKYRGKMLRPALVLLCGQSAGGITENHRALAAAMELIHMGTLVHDDVLDEAEIRRRGKTMNRLYGNEAAVLLGDILVCRAFQLCSSVCDPPTIRQIAAMTCRLCEGELMQLVRREQCDLTEEMYLEIIERKTASLMAVCCYTGARAAGAAESLAGGLELFGRNLGIAFQMIDDIADLTGTEAQSGKTLGRDLEKGKMTLPGIHYWHAADETRRRWVKRMITESRREDYAEYIQKLEQAGSFAYAKNRAADFVDAARAALPQDMDPHGRQALTELARLVLE